jgi:DNA-binding beta-propeller fold protein YncE
MTLALDGATAWVACKEDETVESLAGETVALDGQAIAVLSAFGAVWALSERGTLRRIGGEAIDLDARAPYNLWSGAGSLWAIDDASGEVIRIDPRTHAVIAKTPVGDGPADMAFDGETVYVINHRDRTLVRLGRKTALATIGDANAAPERMALLDGALWITGRGMDLLKVDPRTGKTLRTIEIGGSGIDVVAAGRALYVPSRSEAVDQSGLPTMQTLRRVSTEGKASVIAEATDRVDVHGIVADDTHVWLADNRAGTVYRIALTG